MRSGRLGLSLQHQRGFDTKNLARRLFLIFWLSSTLTRGAHLHLRDKCFSKPSRRRRHLLHATCCRARSGAFLLDPGVHVPASFLARVNRPHGFVLEPPEPDSPRVAAHQSFVPRKGLIFSVCFQRLAAHQQSVDFVESAHLTVEFYESRLVD